MTKEQEAQKKMFRDRFKKLQNILFDLGLDKEPRPQQTQALDWIQKPIAEGKKFMLLEMPTGVGKSYFAMLFIDWYMKNINKDAKFDLLTNTKILQTQYVDEFNYINNLWGKANYQCSTWQNSCEYGKVCNKNKKSTCEDCPYDEYKSKWLDGKISLTNFHIHGLYSLYNPAMIKLRAADVLIIDEAHLVEEVINGFVAFSLSSKVWKNILKDTTAAQYDEEITHFKNLDDIAKWIGSRFLVDLETADIEHRKQLQAMVTDKKKWEQKLKVLANIEDLKLRLNKFLDDYKTKLSDWVCDKKIFKGELTWEIQPLWTGDILAKYIWSNYKHVVLMSGTIIDPLTFSELNGILKDRSSFLNQPSPFPVKNRPIYYYPQGKLNYTNKETVWENYIPAIKQILKKYKGQKGIIHTGNYELLEWLKRDIQDDRLIFADPSKREEALQEHIGRVDDAVIVSPSMMHGVDLKDDLSRFQIILKVPYPSLASKVNKQRMQTKGNWYSWKTICDIVQSYGRSIRSDIDHADTFILDECFGDLLRNNASMFPKYFLDAIIKMKPKRR